MDSQDTIMHVSSLPFLVAAVFGYLAWLVRRLSRQGAFTGVERRRLFTVLGVLLAWGAVTAALAFSGFYTRPRFLSWAPGYWMPYVPVVMVMTLVLTSRSLRDGLRKLVDATPAAWLTAIHIVRILALGSLIKAANGLFPELFAGYVGVPDLLFGLSAIPVTLLVARGRLSGMPLVAWHVIGAMVIIVPAVGFMHLFMKEPLFDRLFAFPMALAPTLVVPTLVMLNLLVAWRESERLLLRR